MASPTQADRPSPTPSPPPDPAQMRGRRRTDGNYGFSTTLMQPSVFSWKVL